MNQSGVPYKKGINPVEAAELLAAGELVILPTETVYGLAGSASDARAVAKIYARKQRPIFNPLIVHVADLQMAHEIGEFDPVSQFLAKRFWPGPLTLILPKKPGAKIAELALAGLDHVALRMPNHPLALAVLTALQGPIVAPSANRSGALSPTSAAHARAELGLDIAFVDGGPCQSGVESTILRMSDHGAQILRPGALSRERLSEALAEFPHTDPSSGQRAYWNMQSQSDAQGAPILAPGMMASHYAPNASIRLNAMSAQADELFLGFGPRSIGADANLSPSGDLVEAAANLFAFLRLLDARQPACIAVASIPSHGLGEAINDRLARAAAPRPA